ncbi:putative RNA-directed DNA polymerase from transposon BS [Trichonephila clavipes]|nr:putative RNA-directed DNA polymerase from transposon BS [Trichonephila clavipes]
MTFDTVDGVRTVKSFGSNDMDVKCHEWQQPNEIKRDKGADSRTPCNTYITFVRSILENGLQVYQVASASNIDSLERIQFSTTRIINGLRNSCPRDIVLYKADLLPLRLRSKFLLAKYFVKLISFGDQHKTSSYAGNWNNNRRLKGGSPLAIMTVAQ